MHLPGALDAGQPLLLAVIDADHKPILSFRGSAVRDSPLVEIENAAHWNMASKRVEAQARASEILVTLGGTEGVLFLANPYHAAGKPIVPLIEPNVEYELDRFAEREGERAGFNKEARQRYLMFATGPDARWPGNFRDLAASITRMATLSPKGRIDLDCVEAEIVRLQRLWSGQTDNGPDLLAEVLESDVLAEIDPFDRVQLAEVIRVCRNSRSLSEAGRTLFAAPRARRTTANDADRLRKYLGRFGLDWGTLS